MNHSQRCQMAATDPACPEQSVILLPVRHLELIRAATEAYRRILDTSAIGPEWEALHRAWLNAAETLAITVIYHAESQGIDHDD